MSAQIKMFDFPQLKKNTDMVKHGENGIPANSHLQSQIMLPDSAWCLNASLHWEAGRKPPTYPKQQTLGTSHVQNQIFNFQVPYIVVSLYQTCILPVDLVAYKLQCVILHDGGVQ